MITVVYDSTGRPIFIVEAEIDVAGAVTIENPPEGYYLKSIAAETGEPVFEPIPLTKEQQDIEEIKAQMNVLLGVSE